MYYQALQDVENMADSKRIAEFKKIELDNIPHVDKQGSISLFKQWLTENYKIKVNSLDTSDISIETTDINPIQYNFDINESDIYLHALEDGLKISRTIIGNILYSPNQITHYNPIVDYFEGLKGKYKGPSQIDYMFNCLQLKETEDIEQCRYLFRKWIYATAACVLGKRSNDVALGIVSEQAGIGKTTFFYELLPDHMKQYSLVVQKRNNPLIDTEIFSNKVILNFDEFAAITPANENQFKQLVSSETISTKAPMSRRNRLVPRIASVCFTSNKTAEQGGFLRNNDSGMLRRLAIISVNSITDYRELLNANELWAEAVAAVEGGLDYIWNQEDYERFIKLNKKYVISTNAMKLIQMYYCGPEVALGTRLMSSTDLLLELKHDKRIPSHMTNVDAVSIGQALSTLGYTRKMIRVPEVGPRYMYNIKKKDI